MQLPAICGKRSLVTFVCLTAVVSPQAPSVRLRLSEDLQWNQAQRESRFAHMDRLFPSNLIAHGTHIHPLPQGPPLHLRPAGQALQTLIARDRLAGILVLQNGRIRVEAYGLGATRETRWTSFSVTKSITSTLVAAALLDRSIQSLEDPVTHFLPELHGSAYEAVSLRQLLSMTSGVRWVENYTAPGSDNVRLYSAPAPLPQKTAEDPTIAYLRTLPRQFPPGTHWLYNTGETDLTGVLVRRATGKSLSTYLSEKIWQPFGMESNATWITDEQAREFGGSGISATLRDFGRFGEFVRLGGKGVVPPTWFPQATHTQAQTSTPGRGYGFGWWTFPGGSYAALGIFGQSILIDPTRNLVIVTTAAWPQATSPALAASRAALWTAVRKAIDRNP